LQMWIFNKIDVTWAMMNEMSMNLKAVK